MTGSETYGTQADAKADEKNKRIQFEFSQSAYQSLLQLRSESGVKTLSDLVRNAIRLYQWYIKQKKEGYTLALVKNGKVEKEVEIMF